MILPSRSFPPLRAALVIAADAAALVTLAPDWPALGRHLMSADEWVAAVGADHAAASVAGAALWLCAIWLGVALLLMALAGAPGWLGATGRRLTKLIVPAAAARTLAGIAGLSISLSVIAPAAAAVGPLALASSSSPAPAWPISSPTATAPAAPSPPGWPVSTVVTGGPPGSPTGTDHGTDHRVVPGDCLWNLAANQLGPTGRPGQIAALTAAWYAANRAVIGADPALLHPGQLLVEPRRTS